MLFPPQPAWSFIAKPYLALEKLAKHETVNTKKRQREERLRLAAAPLISQTIPQPF
jgi:hypothetical protein